MAELELGFALHKMLVAITSIIFNIVLILMLYVQKTEHSSKQGKGFRRLAFVVLAGSIWTCLTFLARSTVFWRDHQKLVLFMLYVEYAANTLLTYYFSRYIELFIAHHIMDLVGINARRIDHRFGPDGFSIALAGF